MRVKVLSAGRAGLPAPDGLERGTGLPELQRLALVGFLPVLNDEQLCSKDFIVIRKDLQLSWYSPCF